jgi:hypothetical protein
MKKSWVLLLMVLVGSPMAGAETSSRPVPQPRVRLDPNSYATIPPAKTAGTKESPGSVVAMSPMVVRSTVIAADGPQPKKQRDGFFSLSEGGRMFGKEKSGVRFEVGVWPYQNILWRNDKFKSDLNHVGTEFVRITW